MDDSKVAVLLEDIKSQFRVFGDGLQMLNEKIDAQGKMLSEKIGSLDYRLTSMDHRLISLDERVTSLDKRVTSLDERVTSLDERVTSLDERVISLDERVTSLDHRFASFDQRLTSLVTSNTKEHRLMMQMIKELSEEQQKLKRAK